MELFYGLDDITLIPSATNSGYVDVDFYVQDTKDQTGANPNSLPIFASPMESIVDEKAAKSFVDAGIKPVLPVGISIETRLTYCQWIFSAFTVNEIQRYFINQDRRNTNSQFHLCIDHGNGHDSNLLTLCLNLRKRYGNQVIIMAGNVACPEIYTEYSRAGIDYMRVGIASGSLDDMSKFGFNYPMASLLDSFKKFKKTSGVGLTNQVKIIADGGINSYSKILKAIALGADYVMIGKDFARVLEAAGEIYQKNNTKIRDTSNLLTIDPATIKDFNRDKAKINGYSRFYRNNTDLETRARQAGYPSVEAYLKDDRPGNKIDNIVKIWVNIDMTLEEWVDDFKKVAYHGFLMTGSTGWKEFKKNARYGVSIPNL